MIGNVQWVWGLVISDCRYSACCVCCYKKSPLNTRRLSFKTYPEPGSNRHGRNGHRILSPGCLPIPPSGPFKELCYKFTKPKLTAKKNLFFRGL